MKSFVIVSAIILLSVQLKAQYDICVYGGTSAGVMAMYTAAMQHKKVVLIEPGKHLGGLSSGAQDILILAINTLSPV